MNENRLEGLREENNLKEIDIAKMLNVSKSKISEWENNKISIPTKRLIQLSNFYKVSIDYIVRLSNIRNMNINFDDNLDLVLIGNRIKEIRTSLELTLTELGKKLNSNYSTISRYENGQNLIQSDILIAICEMSNYSIDWVLGRTNKKYRI